MGLVWLSRQRLLVSYGCRRDIPSQSRDRNPQRERELELESQSPKNCAWKMLERGAPSGRKQLLLLSGELAFWVGSQGRPEKRSGRGYLDRGASSQLSLPLGVLGRLVCLLSGRLGRRQVVWVGFHRLQRTVAAARAAWCPAWPATSTATALQVAAIQLHLPQRPCRQSLSRHSIN